MPPRSIEYSPGFRSDAAAPPPSAYRAPPTPPLTSGMMVTFCLLPTRCLFSRLYAGHTTGACLKTKYVTTGFGVIQPQAW